MNWDRIAGNWKQMKGALKERWGKLTDDEFDQLGGHRDQLVGKIQERYGCAKDEAENQVREWENRQLKVRTARRAARALALRPDAAGRPRAGRLPEELERVQKQTGAAASTAVTRRQGIAMTHAVFASLGPPALGVAVRLRSRSSSARRRVHRRRRAHREGEERDRHRRRRARRRCHQRRDLPRHRAALRASSTARTWPTARPRPRRRR